MKTTKSSNKLIISLSQLEFWFLAKFFSPGLIFGVDDPTEGMSEEELQAAETEVYASLNQAGVLEMAETGQLRIDEMLGAMVYSCIHSRDMLAVRSTAVEDQRYYHFLPDWQLELAKVKEGYQLSLFKERDDLFSHILGNSKTALRAGNKEINFIINERDLELAAFLFETGKKERALEMMPGDRTQKAKMEEFLHGYISPELHLIFDMLYRRDDEEEMRSRRTELLQTGEGLFWFEHELVGEEALPTIHIRGVTPDTAGERFELMLPSNEL